MSTDKNALAISLFSEILAADQKVRYRLTSVLPKGMEISHFYVLNHLSRSTGEKSPAQLAKTFHVTKGAMTNTLSKLEWAGFIHIRPDWDDARRKQIQISPAGKKAVEHAFAVVVPEISKIVDAIGEDKVRSAIPVLRDLRINLGDGN